MKNFSRKSFLFVFVFTAMVMLLCFSASAEREGSYTYTVNDGKATITDVDKLGRLDIVVPSTLGGYPVTQIGDNAFDYNVYIKSVTIPDGVISIGKRAFADCDNLKKVTIPASVKTIGEYAFYDCVKLSDVIIPNGVTTIEADAFFNCDSISSITIPESVTNIGGALFVNCDNIKEVLVDENNQSYVSDDGKILFNKSKTLLVQYLSTSTQTSYSIPDGVVTVGDNAFSNCVNLNKITLPEGVVTIGEYAFSRCNGLTDFIISDSVTTIGKKAFCDSRNLEQITIGDSVTSVGKGAFENCYKLHKVYAKDIESWLKIVFEDGQANPMAGAEELYFGNQLVTDFVVPESITTVYDYAFYDCESLTSVTIPDSVTSVGDTAFCDCSNLESVTVGNGVKTISRRMFSNCKKLNEVILSDSVTTIGDSAFSGCGFESFTIPDSVTTIEDSAFSGCGFENITIPDSVTSVGRAAFSACNNLKRIEIPSSVVSLGAGAFSGTGLTEVIISEGVESIGSCAFENCFDLNGVKVPNSVTEIGTMAFGYFDYGGGEFEDCIEKNRDFTITSGICSAAHTYAKKHGFKFIDDNSNEHSFNTVYTKGTFGKDGSKVVSCKCGESETETYPAVTSVTLSTAKYVYNGKNRTPKVTVKDKEGKTLTKNVDYKLTVASKRAGIGRYTVKVTLIGNYEGTKNLYFYILPGTPSSVKSSSQTNSSVKLSWSAVKGAAGYKVYRYSPSKKAYVSAGTTTKTNITVSKLLAGTKYTFRVYAYGKTAAGKVYNSNGYTLIKTATCTATPTLKLASTAKGRATLAWTNVSGETGYQVYYATSKTGAYKKLANYKANTAKVYKTGLTSGKTYYFKVRTYIKADSGYVYSPFSSVKSIKIK